MPINEALRAISKMQTDAKHPGERLLFRGVGSYGANPSYLQNATLELTPERLLFYETVMTRSGLLNIVTALMAPRYSFSIYLNQIAKIVDTELAYRPALTLYLSSQERLVVQCNDQARFARELRGAWETIRQDPARVT